MPRFPKFKSRERVRIPWKWRRVWKCRGMLKWNWHHSSITGNEASEEEEAENNRVTENGMIRVAACSGGRVAVKLNVTHWLCHRPLPLFALPDRFVTFPFSCVVCMRRICARDNTHPAPTLYIPGSSGPKNRSAAPPPSLSSVLFSSPQPTFTPEADEFLKKNHLSLKPWIFLGVFFFFWLTY